MLTQSFNYSNSENEVDLNLSTAHGRLEYFNGIATNPDFSKYSANNIALDLANSNNEGTAAQIMAQADATSGKLGGRMSSLANYVDGLHERVNGSRSGNIGAAARNEHDTLDLIHPDFNMPIISADADDINASMQAVYIELLEAGVYESDLNYVMREGNDPRNMLSELHDIAIDNNIELDGYIRGMDQSLVDASMARGINDIAPVIGTVMDEKTLSANDFDYEPDKPLPVAMSLG